MEKEELAILLGTNIARYRENAGWTQAQLAEKVGVSTAFISRVERGEKSMKIHTLYRMSEVLKVSCDALLHSDSAALHLGNINALLEDQSSAYLSSIEDLLRVCNEHFSDKKDSSENL